MSEEQKQLKKARKTGPYEIKRDPKWCYAVLPENVLKACAAASQVRDNALKITAALNLYHEKRGSPHRHNVPDNLKCYYGKLIVALNNEVNALEKAQSE
jgi:hypothetical protein